MNQLKEENDNRNYLMINLHEIMGPGQDQTRDPSICSWTRYQLRYGARLLEPGVLLQITCSWN